MMKNYAENFLKILNGMENQFAHTVIVQTKEHYKLKSNGEFKGLYKCKQCKKRFTVTLGTMFEGSHVSLKKWFYALYIFLTHKKGISSIQLSKDILL